MPNDQVERRAASPTEGAFISIIDLFLTSPTLRDPIARIDLLGSKVSLFEVGLISVDRPRSVG